MRTQLRQVSAFVLRDFHLTRRYISWVIVFAFYAMVSSATIALIGVAANNYELTLTLVIGALLWSFLSVLFNEIAMSIAFERWEGTLEYTFMAPAPRLLHLAGVSLYSLLYSIGRAIFVLAGLLLFVKLSIRGANLLGILVVLLISSIAFIGLGLMAAVLPVMSPERGAEATNIFQGMLLLVSGIYYPVDVLPRWLQPLSAISPATYALSACRKLLGIGRPGSYPGHLVGASITDVGHEIVILVLMGVVMVPAGLWVFSRAEAWAKKKGKLKRTG
ncbi:MAG TPA: ABC transporter permease [Blastocatellia bacterium]|nr:ABC transporter permease [Blastocatellia bacterium]